MEWNLEPVQWNPGHSAVMVTATRVQENNDIVDISLAL